jgi:hypothetical protein
MNMKVTRRDALMSFLFGAGYVGLRALATGLPVSFLLNPRRALADGTLTCASKDKAQYFIFATSGSGDPINANVPGMYLDPKITHPADPMMAPTQLTLAGQGYTAAAPWASLPQNVLDRTTFFHLMTNTPVHPKEPEVLQLMGQIYKSEMLPSVLAKQLQPCLSTIQAQPITVGATSPSEGLQFEGAALPIIPPVALKDTLSNPAGPLSTLQPLRDQTLNSLMDLYRNGASGAQKNYLDSLITSQTQARSISQNLLGSLNAIKDNTITSQITAALALVQMNVTPVVAIHIPFGGDNHHDAALQTEATQTVSGVGSIASLMSQLAGANLADQVSFVSLNVFGRTLGPANTDGRQHNQNHQVSIAIGKPFKGGVIGGVAPVMTDYGATPIDSKTGMGSASGDIAPADSLASFGKTLLASVGVDATTIGTTIMSGQVIQPALV